jgi:hypothetical protein
MRHRQGEPDRLLTRRRLGDGGDARTSEPDPDAPPETGLINSTPEEILERGTDFRFLTQLRTELQPA